MTAIRIFALAAAALAAAAPGAAAALPDAAAADPGAMAAVPDVVAALPGGAGAPPDGAAGPDLDQVKRKVDGERISLDLEDARVLDILTIYKQLLGVEVQLRCAEERAVSIRFENITVRTSLNAICESAGMRWSLQPGEPPALLVECDTAGPAPVTEGRVVVKREGAKPGAAPPPAAAGKGGKDPLAAEVSIELADADLADTLGMAARLIGAQRLVVDVKLGGAKVTFKAEKTTVREFLDAICAQAGAKWELRPEPVPTLVVDPKR